MPVTDQQFSELQRAVATLQSAAFRIQYPGNGVPTMAAPIGSIYQRQDAPDANHLLYVSTGAGTWTPLISSSGAASFVRSTQSYATASLANNAVENDSVIVLGKLSVITQITSSVASRVRFYDTSADRTSDASRAIGTTATAGTGVLGEFVFTSPGQTIYCGPPPIVYNNDNPVATIIYAATQNRSGSSNVVTVTMTLGVQIVET